MKASVKAAAKWAVGVIGFIVLVFLTVVVAFFELFVIFTVSMIVRPFTNKKISGKDIFALTPPLFKMSKIVAAG